MLQVALLPQVDWVCTYSHAGLKIALQQLKPRVFVKGQDTAIGEVVAEAGRVILRPDDRNPELSIAAQIGVGGNQETSLCYGAHGG